MMDDNNSDTSEDDIMDNREDDEAEDELQMCEFCSGTPCDWKLFGEDIISYVELVVISKTDCIALIL
jgi:hypothetical protein